MKKIFFFLSICIQLIYSRFLQKNDLEQCSNHGYEYNRQCFCQNKWNGDQCQNPITPQYFDDLDYCDNILNRLDSLFNISPNDSNIKDDYEFPRFSKDSIGQKWKNKPKTWITMQSTAQKFQIFGQSIDPFDVKQGDLNNCYMISAFASLANIRNGEPIKEVFMTKQDNPNHIYVTRWMILGKPRMVAVDNWIPGLDNYGSGLNKPFFSEYSGDFDFWPIIIEKAWAKIHGSYTNTEYGYQTDVWKAITQAPNYEFLHKKLQPEEIYNSLQQFMQNEWPVGAATTLNVKKDLQQNHAYSVLGVYHIKLQNSAQSSFQKLIKIFNPYNKYQNQNNWNKWSIDGNEWDEFRKNQVGQFKPQSGMFFLTPEDYKDEFGLTNWAELHQGYKSHYHEMAFRDLNKEEFRIVYFKVNEKALNKPIYISLEITCDLLLYRKCESPWIARQFDVWDSKWQKGTIIEQAYDITSITVKFERATIGEYQIDVYFTRRQSWIKYFIITAYAPEDSISWDLNHEKNYEIYTNCKINCNNHGICNQLTGKCDCFHMYSGNECEIEDQCQTSRDCDHGGWCTAWGCWCSKQWKGNDCRTPNI